MALQAIKPDVTGGTYLNSTVTKPVKVDVLPLGAVADLNDPTKEVGVEFPNPSERTYLTLINLNPVAAGTDANANATANTGNLVTVTIVPQGRPEGLKVTPYTVDVPAGSAVVVGSFKANLFNSSGGSIRVFASVANKVQAIVLQT